MHLVVVDDRQYRSPIPKGGAGNLPRLFGGGPQLPGAFDPNATMFGADQEAWLDETLRSSAARWNVMAQQTIMAACDLIPRLNAMTFSGAPSELHRSINRCHVGVVHGALGRELAEWRPPQVADYVRIKGSCRYAPGQTEAQVLADMRGVLAELEQRFPGLKTSLTPEHLVGRPMMPTFEVARDSPIVQAVNRAYERVRGEPQPTGAPVPPGYYGTDAAHLQHAAGMEGVVCGPGGRYNTMPDERVDIPDYLDIEEDLSYHEASAKVPLPTLASSKIN